MKLMNGTYNKVSNDRENLTIFINYDDFFKAMKRSKMNELIILKHKKAHFIFFVVDGFSKGHYLFVKKLFKRMEGWHEKVPVILININEISDDLLSYVSLPVNGMVSKYYVEKNMNLILRTLFVKDEFFEPAFLKKIAEKNETHKNKDLPIKKLSLNDNKVDQIFTETEMRVYHLMINGYNNKQISKELFFSTSTVALYISNIIRKVGANNRTEAVVKAFRRNWVKTEK